MQTVLVERGQTAEEVAVKIREAAGGVDLKFALECTGVESSIRTCIFVSRRESGFKRSSRSCVRGFADSDIAPGPGCYSRWLSEERCSSSV